MNLKHVALLLTFLVVKTLHAQDNNYAVFDIAPELLKNADAVIRESNQHIKIIAFNKVKVIEKRVVTVFNSNGKQNIEAYISYDTSKSIKTLEANVYNDVGDHIKRIKKKDFKDVSASDGFSLYRDDRIKYLEYTPLKYPYTVSFEVEYDTSFTVNLPVWMPVNDYGLSLEKSTYTIENLASVDIKKKPLNFKVFNVSEADNVYTVGDIEAITYESYSPQISTYLPSLKVALKQFSMKGVEGVNNDWKSFGKWMYDELLADTMELPEVHIEEAKALVSENDTDIEKAQKIYSYLQDNTRYISVQAGIGGWKPMLAEDVRRLGYGDCKGLSNYTQALLQAVGVKAYYTVIYGSKKIRDIDPEFSSLQGNHVILTIKSDNDYIPLECTSQSAPFGYGANFTDGRKALIVTKDGGEIIETKSFKDTENVITTKAKLNIDAKGIIIADLNILSKGVQYDYRTEVERMDQQDQYNFYKDKWDDINTIKFNNLNFNNDKSRIEFKEHLDLEISKYPVKIGNDLLFNPNMFNKSTYIPPRYSNRKLPFIIERGFVSESEYTIHLEEGVKAETLFDDINLSSPFGAYSVSIIREGDTVVYRRRFTVKQGRYDKSSYSEFRDFLSQVKKQDNTKIILNSTL